MNKRAEIAKSEHNDLDPTLAKKLEPLVLPGKVSEVVELLEISFASYHSGPLPPPEQLAGYESVLPGASDRIISMAEKEQAHRHKQEGRMVSYGGINRILAQLGALFTMAAVVFLVGFCTYIHQPLAAGIVAALAAIAGYFLHKDNTPVSHGSPPAPAKRKRR